MKYLYFALIFFLSNYSHCQSDSAYSISLRGEGLSELILVDVKTIHADNIDRFSLWLGGAFGQDGPDYIGASYYIPKKHLFNIHGGMGVGFEGSAFFLNREKKRKKRITVKVSEQGWQTTSYSYSFPIVKRRSLGFHYGLSYAYYGPDEYDAPGNPTVNTLSAGLTFLSARHIEMKIWRYGVNKLSAFVTAHADVLYHFGHAYPEGLNTFWSQETLELFVDSYSRNLGGRIYLEAYLTKNTTSKGNINMGYKCILGFGTKGFSGMVPVIFGGGFVFS